MQPHLRRAWVEIDLGALRRNGGMIAAHVGVGMLPMVKADAYGLGAVSTVRALEPLAPWGYGVATVEEGAELRDAGVTRPIVVFTPLLHDQYAEAQRLHLVPALSTATDIEHWLQSAGGEWHLAIDTGMSRAGIRWDEVAALEPVLARSVPQGVFTHFHSADTDASSVTLQEERFRKALRHVHGSPLRHVENSCSIIRRGASEWDLVRPGIVLYGAGGGADARIVPEQVVHLRARVIAMRTISEGDTVSYGATWRADGERRIATLAIGYADGYPRSMGNAATALVRGARVPVVGVVTMDMTMVDVTGVACEIGDVATLIGRDGDDLITMDAAAQAAGLSPYELLTRMRSRIVRTYRDAEP